MGNIVVVHPCSSFSLYCQMLPLQHAKFYIVDFLIFSAHICTVFWTLCINGEGFFCVLMYSWQLLVLLVLYCN